MKGSLHTDELLHAVLNPESGLRTGRRLSHVYLFEFPAIQRPLLVTDAAVNIAPSLEEKRDIIQNAIDLAHVMGIASRSVALLVRRRNREPKDPLDTGRSRVCKMAQSGPDSGWLGRTVRSPSTMP